MFKREPGAALHSGRASSVLRHLMGCGHKAAKALKLFETSPQSSSFFCPETTKDLREEHLKNRV